MAASRTACYLLESISSLGHNAITEGFDAAFQSRGDDKQVDSPSEILADDAESVPYPDVAERVATLVVGAISGVRRTGRALVVRQCGKRLQGVTTSLQNRQRCVD